MANGLFSAIGAVYKALRARLTRTGIHVGSTADYPRVEIHSITESEWLDKGHTLKTISCIVECISDKRMQDVMDMSEENLSRMLGENLMLDDGWAVVGVVSGQLQELTEVTDTAAILYRLLQNVTIYVEQINQ
jgi:hypothetical protein